MTPETVEEDVEHVVATNVRRTPAIVELLLRPLGPHLHYLPGQYVLLGDIAYRVPVRSYSIANAPRDSGELTLLVTEVAGGETSTWLSRLRPGDRLLVSGPYGTFLADPESSAPVLYLAGGSGLAPVRALAEVAVESGRPEQATLLFSARTEADVVDRERFEEWARQLRGFRFLRTLTRESGPPPLGRIHELLPELFPDLGEHEVYAAGAPGFVDACAEAARACGTRPGRLHTEAFFEEPRPWHSSSAPADASR
ncbi:MAG TPA: FAD-binding oxidoreductase [Gaiellaceae bacterium]|nr:FAD-binding oxidoreductase [Gaiellaceae bacterium]